MSQNCTYIPGFSAEQAEALRGAFVNRLGQTLQGVTWDSEHGLRLHWEFAPQLTNPWDTQPEPAKPLFHFTEEALDAGVVIAPHPSDQGSYVVDIAQTQCCDELAAYAERQQWEAEAYRLLRDATDHDTLPVMVVIAGESGAVEGTELDAFMAAQLGVYVPEVD